MREDNLTHFMFDFGKYQKCRFKKVTYMVCRPPIGTVVFNKYRDILLLREFKNCGYGEICKKMFLTPAEVQKVNTDYKGIHAGLIKRIKKERIPRLVTPDTMVLCGTMGEYYVVPENLDGEFKVPNSDKKIIEHKRDFIFETNDGVSCYDWFAIEKKLTGTRRLCRYVSPETYDGIEIIRGLMYSVNTEEVEHGLGDFFVCDIDEKGYPDADTLRVVNGLIFSSVYNISGIKGGFKFRPQLQEPFPLWQ